MHSSVAALAPVAARNNSPAAAAAAVAAALVEVAVVAPSPQVRPSVPWRLDT